MNNYPKLHNAMWPGLVGKEPGTDHPPISLERMLELTAKAKVGDRKFDGVDLFLFHTHTDPDASEAAIRKMADSSAPALAAPKEAPALPAAAAEAPATKAAKPATVKEEPVVEESTQPTASAALQEKLASLFGG